LLNVHEVIVAACTAKGITIKERIGSSTIRCRFVYIFVTYLGIRFDFKKSYESAVQIESEEQKKGKIAGSNARAY